MQRKLMRHKTKPTVKTMTTLPSIIPMKQPAVRRQVGHGPTATAPNLTALLAIVPQHHKAQEVPEIKLYHSNNVQPVPPTVDGQKLLRPTLISTATLTPRERRTKVLEVALLLLVSSQLLLTVEEPVPH